MSTVALGMLGILVWQAAFAAEPDSKLNIKRDVFYNGGAIIGKSEGASVCDLRVHEINEGTLRVSIQSPRLDGPRREFVLSQVDERTFEGKGSTQSWIDGTKNLNPDDFLSLQLKSDGSPLSYRLSFESKTLMHKELKCIGLLDAPY